MKEIVRCRAASILELQDHGIREQAAVNAGILRIHDETGIPLVVTNDAHYLRKEDAYSHDVLLCYPDREDSERHQPHEI